jgi:hypothetical protein
MIYNKSSLPNIDTELISTSSIRTQPPTTIDIDIETIQTTSQIHRYEVRSRLGHLDGDQCPGLHSRARVHVEFRHLPRLHGRRRLRQQRLPLLDPTSQERRERRDALGIGVRRRHVLQSRALGQRWQRHGGAQNLW